MAPRSTKPQRRARAAAHCLLATAALCSPQLSLSFLMPAPVPALAPVPASRARLGQQLSPAAASSCPSSAAVGRLYARHLGGGLDPPFQFGGTWRALTGWAYLLGKREPLAWEACVYVCWAMT